MPRWQLEDDLRRVAAEIWHERPPDPTEWTEDVTLQD
jgi:hypothetical protein